MVAVCGVFRTILTASCLIAATTACGPPKARIPDPTFERGSESSARERRLQSTLANLARGTAAVRAVRVSLSDRHGFGAWAWREGEVKVTPALVDHLNDTELAAVVAHELAHLLVGGHLGAAPAAIDGADAEHIADSLGCELMGASGMPRSAMTRMLERLSQALPENGTFAERAAAMRSGPCPPDPDD